MAFALRQLGRHGFARRDGPVGAADEMGGIAAAIERFAHQQVSGGYLRPMAPAHLGRIGHDPCVGRERKRIPLAPQGGFPVDMDDGLVARIAQDCARQALELARLVMRQNQAGDLHAGLAAAILRRSGAAA